MIENKTSLIVLAAGLASRYGSMKQLEPVGPSGETILEYSIFDAIKAGFTKVVFVIRQSFENEFRNHFVARFGYKIEVDFAFQELTNVPKHIKVPDTRIKPWGTGHAILTASPKINGPFAVINADDFYGCNSFQLLYNHLMSLNPLEIGGGLIGYKLKNTLSKNGSVSRGICEVSSDGFLDHITERTKIGIDSEQAIYFEDKDKKFPLSGDELVSMNLAGFTHPFLKFLETGFDQFIQKNFDHPTSEYYLPTAIDAFIRTNGVKFPVIETPDHTFGVTYKEDKEQVVNNIKILVMEGIYPNYLWS